MCKSICAVYMFTINITIIINITKRNGCESIDIVDEPVYTLPCHAFRLANQRLSPHSVQLFLFFLIQVLFGIHFFIHSLTPPSIVINRSRVRSSLLFLSLSISVLFARYESINDIINIWRKREAYLQWLIAFSLLLLLLRRFLPKLYGIIVIVVIIITMCTRRFCLLFSSIFFFRFVSTT